MSLWLKKLNVFLMEKHSIFQNNVENFKSVEILQSRRDFFKCHPAITFDTFTLTNSNFQHIYVLGILQENKKLSSHGVIPNPESFATIFGKNENSLIFECILLVSPCHSF